jgi:hypothetical protein
MGLQGPRGRWLEADSAAGRLPMAASRTPDWHLEIGS